MQYYSRTRNKGRSLRTPKTHPRARFPYLRGPEMYLRDRFLYRHKRAESPKNSRWEYIWRYQSACMEYSIFYARIRKSGSDACILTLPRAIAVQSGIKHGDAVEVLVRKVPEKMTLQEPTGEDRKARRRTQRSPRCGASRPAFCGCYRTPSSTTAAWDAPDSRRSPTSSKKDARG